MRCTRASCIAATGGGAIGASLAGGSGDGLAWPAGTVGRFDCNAHVVPHPCTSYLLD